MLETPGKRRGEHARVNALCVAWLDALPKAQARLRTDPALLRRARRRRASSRYGSNRLASAASVAWGEDRPAIDLGEQGLSARWGRGRSERGRARFHGERPRGWFRRDECGRTLGEQIVSADVRPPERLRHGLVRDLPLADVQPCSQVLILGHRSFPSLRCQRERMA